jgi:hypothetical protein
MWMTVDVEEEEMFAEDDDVVIGLIAEIAVGTDV